MTGSSSPSVFVSSTCYDLSQVRENLKNFIESLGYSPVLSDYKSFPVDPDLSTIDNCRKAVQEHADIFVLIVGGRYGSVDEQGRSITNMEYLEARAMGIPVYAFVSKSVLNILPVWKENPEANLSSVVDSPKLFEFVDQLRTSGNVWVHPFESATDITETLRGQWAFLFRDALKLRAKARQQTLSDTLHHLRGEAFRIVVERPRAWEHRLFSSVLKQELENGWGLKRDLSYGVTFDEVKNLDLQEFIAWTQTQLAQLGRITSGVTHLVNVALLDALGPAGVDGDPDKLVYVARKIAEGHRKAMEWTLRYRRIELEDELRPVAEVLSEFSDDFIQKIEEFSDELYKGLHEVLSRPRQPGEVHTLELNVVFEPPPIDKFDRELALLKRKLGLF